MRGEKPVGRVLPGRGEQGGQTIDGSDGRIISAGVTTLGDHAMNRKGVLLSLLLLGLAALAACTVSSSGSSQQANGGEAKMSEPTPSPSPQQSRPYSTNLDELRTAFNRDRGKVRLVTLLSPT